VKYIETINNGLGLLDGEEFFLGGAWVVAEGIRYHQMFPEALGMDCTHGTNSKKRPLFRVTGRTTAGKNIPLINAFFPDQQGWVFEWVLQTALPLLLDTDCVKRTSIVLTDEDNQELNQLAGAVAANIMPNMKNRLCAWHKIDRGFYLLIKKFIKGAINKEFVSMVIGFLYAMCRDVETLAEQDYYHNRFEKWVKSAPGKKTLLHIRICAYHICTFSEMRICATPILWSDV
jgi:hypothetical protein